MPLVQQKKEKQLNCNKMCIYFFKKEEKKMAHHQLIMFHIFTFF